eukprot:scaffold1757_cov266-Pinguiococcus_pyrenoidosus.AAC.11
MLVLFEPSQRNVIFKIIISNTHCTALGEVSPNLATNAGARVRGSHCRDAPPVELENGAPWTMLAGGSGAVWLAELRV